MVTAALPAGACVARAVVVHEWPTREPSDREWLRLAEAREADHPADAVFVYQRVVEHVRETTDRRAYQQAVRILKRAAAAARAAGQADTFAVYVEALCERHRHARPRSPCSPGAPT